MDADRPADYSKMTTEDFDQCLDGVLLNTTVSTIRSLPGVEEIIREEFNNEVLDRWARDNPELAYPDGEQEEDPDGV